MFESLIGHQLANFKVERLLGQGGMAEVYFGRDVSLQRPVAIKVINNNFRQNPAYAERFISEARAVATWRHENIVQVYYADQEDNLYYFVMEYIDGMDLSSLLSHYADAGELMPHEDVIKIARAVASALDYAHERGVVHRDVKPANTMISTDDRVVLMDFGLALDVQQGSIGEVFGTPHYVSPEQARRSADAVPQSDVYSLGVMLYEMLTGIVPFDDPSPTAVALQHLSMPPPSPRSLNRNLSQQVEDVLLKALSKKPDERYPTATAFIDALDTALKITPDVLATAELPPLPPGITPPNRLVSGRTVSEHIALNISMTQTQEKPEMPRIPPTRKSAQSEAPVEAIPAPNAVPSAADTNSKRSFPLWVIGVGALLVVAIIAVIVLSGGGNGDEEVLTVADAPTAQPTRTAVESADESVINPPTDVPIATNLPTELPTTTNQPTDAPTLAPTSTPEPPTATTIPPSATPEPPTQAVAVEPTVLYPNGQRLEFFWNDQSFYWLNSASSSLRVSQIVFSAIDENDNATGYRLEGSRWTIGYHSVEPNRCVAVELLQTTNWLRPPACRGYNSTLTLQQSSDEVFWLNRIGGTQFQVIWNGQEVGRCVISEGNCEVRVP